MTGVGVSTPAQAIGNTMNSDFEAFEGRNINRFRIVNDDQVAGWSSTSNEIELWRDGFQGVSAASGEHFIELNARSASTLYQDLAGIAAGNQIDFSFYHRARRGTDVLNFAITDAGRDNLFGSDDDFTLFSQDYSATTANWVLNDSVNVSPILALGNDVRVSYSAISTGSGNDTVGNFLDRAEIGISRTPSEDVPFEFESSVGLMLMGGAFVMHRRKKKRQASA
ncbi:MAG: hypothetical protein AAGB01_06670 [Cyanobacteria bacterium P01_F01_bin.42]